MGRLFEGHVDAEAILAEAGLPAPAGKLGVWASEDRGHPVCLSTERGVGQWTLSGTKPFCSGATLIDHALITATYGSDRMLGLVSLDQPGVSVAAPDWVGTGMKGADTRTVSFDGAVVTTLVGEPGWYLDRPGFWHGAVGVAACWYGGACGIVATMLDQLHETDPHAMALLGEAEAELYSLRASLRHAAEEIDARPLDVDAASLRALAVRSVVERGSRAILDHASLALGPRPLALDPAHSQRVADLETYLRQHHGRRDHATLGRATMDRRRAASTC